MRGVRRVEPLFILCQRHGCGAYKAVRRPCEQRTRKFCSQRCNALANKNIRHAGRKGVETSASRRKRRALARVKGLTPVAAFRLGYVRGLQSKLTQIRRRYVLVRKDRAGDLVRTLTAAVRS